jgi:hypothetical protein
VSPLFIPALLFYYGIFLLICGITSVSLIGMKAKTALISGGLSGAIAVTIGHFVSQGSDLARAGGVVLCLMLFIIFCWRSAKTLFTVFKLIPHNHPDLNGKGIAFLIISLMAVVTLVVLVFQLVAYQL